MINDPGFKSAGTELNRMMDSLGFADQVGDVYGAALDAAVGNNAGVARNLLDAYIPLSTGQLDLLTRSMAGSASMARPNVYFPGNRPNVQGFSGTAPTAFPSAGQMQQIVSSLLNRLGPEKFSQVIEQFTNQTGPAANQNVPELLGKTFEQLIAALEGKIETKLDSQTNAPVGGKRRKKKGGLSKLKKKFKSVTKFANKTFQSFAKPLEKSLATFLKGFQQGDLLQLGRGLTGGLIGGPVGSFLLDKLMKLGGKNNPMQQVFKQVDKTLDLVQGLHQQQTDLQRSRLTRFLR